MPGPDPQNMQTNVAQQYMNQSNACCNADCKQGNTLTFGYNLFGICSEQSSTSVANGNYTESNASNIAGIAHQEQSSIGAGGLSAAESSSCCGNSLFAYQCNIGSDCGCACSCCGADICYGIAQCLTFAYDAVTCQSCDDGCQVPEINCPDVDCPDVDCPDVDCPDVDCSALLSIFSQPG